MGNAAFDLEFYRQAPSEAILSLRSTTADLLPSREMDERAEELLESVFRTERPATLEHAYRAWRDDSATHAFAEAVRALYLRDYRDNDARDLDVVRDIPVTYAVFGRRAGSTDEVVFMHGGGPIDPPVKQDDHAMIRAVVVPSARRQTQRLRERGVEGYVLFVGDPARYDFTPEADFVYPA
ncbi:hypothetical protein [Burkholderia glumae]|uniref:hypothetical protein n=1 Tax=Burkholderia glumae TaxID=337 RepID=UPI0012974E9F|nr:hypothetical protein [Burkholderia glumae]MCQ0034134.1 hypothetical protein [Burkholderia glumae]MCQ0040436.1 hypothetical protein [Burkholderia glumae]QGA41757.1 hypothetical protein GAS19_30195 [Burkholderia glumae]